MQQKTEIKYCATDLIKGAKRENNTKRPYLLVNPLQGKHIPVSPAEPLQLFKCLCDKIKESLADDDRLLIISFAETATAIGAGVACSLDNQTYYIQTTRENVADTEFLFFSEIHSHATEQKLAKKNLLEAIDIADKIIFVEDEVTTGNTILNLIEQLKKLTDTSNKKIIIASILNGMEIETENNFSEKNIELVYILKSFNKSYEIKVDDYIYDGAMYSYIDIIKNNNNQANVKYYSYDGYINARSVIDKDLYMKHCTEFAETVSGILDTDECGDMLVLGTEEFMYPAMLVAGKIEEKSQNLNVRFHATTRSPILTSMNSNYPLHNRFELPSVYDNERKTFIYNLKRYDKVVIVTDADTRNNDGLSALIHALKIVGNTKMCVVEWKKTFMRSSYKDDDVKILLKDITGLVIPQTTKEREKLIQSGKHYCEMLPIEYSPSSQYMKAYKSALVNYGERMAHAVGEVSDKIVQLKGENIVLVSLARAGIPIGILIKHYIKKKYNINAEHYAISIIRGRGIDNNAMEYILARHSPESIQFIDGWTGKGAILNELRKELLKYDGVSSELAVVADPANITELCGTHEDILIPSSCLNCTVSGLISRTFLCDDIIGENDFHGAVYYDELSSVDLSNSFIDSIEEKFVFDAKIRHESSNNVLRGIDEVKNTAKKFNIDNINLIKPGIGETTRVLLRRIPWKILIREQDINNPMLQHLFELAREKNVPLEYYNLVNYKACGIIKKCEDV